MQSYRLIRVLIHPGKEQTAVSVVARSVSGRSQVDRILWRGVVDAPDVGTVRDVLLAVADAAHRAADRL